MGLLHNFYFYIIQFSIGFGLYCTIYISYIYIILNWECSVNISWYHMIKWNQSTCVHGRSPPIASPHTTPRVAGQRLIVAWSWGLGSQYRIRNLKLLWRTMRVGTSTTLFPGHVYRHIHALHMYIYIYIHAVHIYMCMYIYIYVCICKCT